jgi:pimeloyl-ACP methyl ester carboxylesterase
MLREGNIRRGYARVDGHQVHYREAGTGTPLLLLHQTPSASGEFSRVIPYLAEKYRVIAMDTPGYGMSDCPHRVFEMADYARTVRDFITGLDLGPVNLFGHHTGASIGVELAVTYPEVVARLMLSGLPVWDAAMRQQYLRKMEANPAVFTADGGYLKYLWDFFAGVDPKPDTAAHYLKVSMALLSGERREDAHRAVFEYDSASRLPLLKCPTCVMCGDGDFFFADIETTAALVPGATTRAIPDANVFLAFLRPLALAEAILEFIGDEGENE